MSNPNGNTSQPSQSNAAAKAKPAKLRIGGMTCISCQRRIEKKLRGTAGVKSATVSYRAGTASVTYDPDLVSLKDISAAIQQLDYTVLSGKSQPADTRRAVGILILLFAVFMLLKQFGLADIFNVFPTAETGMDYGMIFVIGLLTSVHCIAMCGGINLSQCIPAAAGNKPPSFADSIGESSGLRTSAFVPSLQYNLGRVAAYTAVGFLVGAVGSALSFGSGVQGALKLFAGVFMLIMGINMLGLIPGLRRLTPHMPAVFADKIDAQKSKSSSPLIVGLLNGLMPCGPLQAMQLYALSTGSPGEGALSMLLFSLGTLPLMFGIGALSSILSQKFTRRVMTVGAALVVVLGISMFSQGWSLAGLPSSTAFAGAAGSAGSETSGEGVTIENGVQVVRSSLESGRYPAITVAAGTPVKWIIDAPQGSLNGCNNAMQIPAYGIQYQFKTGENVIEFTPDKPGAVPYSCWMGMIRSTITVVEAQEA
ncbi:MAG: sulfite exporter TauE/SafE family protein [Clostridiales Family XIII bacterium]|jgi:sulfite exporter TauE/SafE/copper chaperone CopZ|nr:sulfite exporter TauE/SafE family protein [Clostridiales Family XIII bacterium]